MIEKHIKSLLYDYDCVVIPGFGGFITHYVPAEIHPIRHTFLPASKSVAFNEKLKVNDGLLQKFVAQVENIALEEADHLITSFVFELKKQLKEKNRFTFDEVGTLFINHEYRLQFEPENKVNFNNNSFGLPELYCKPISREPVNRIVAINKDRAAIRKALTRQKKQQEENQASAAQPSKRRAALWPLVVFPAITILALGTFILLRDLENKNNLSSLNPFALFNDPMVEAAEGPTAQELEQDLLESAGEENPAETSVELPPVELPPVEEKAAETNTSTATTTKSEEESPKATNNAGPENNLVAEKAETKPLKAEAPVTNVLPKELPVLEKREANLNTVTAPAPVAVTSNTKAEEPIAETTEAKPPVVATSNVTPRYYIVSGGFSNRDNAYKLSAELNKKGFTSKVIEPVANTSIYKVTMGEYDNLEEAKTELNKFKADQGKDLWIFKY